ncbi:MAG: tetratricopeptide repeat-containing sensor histidine kinase [Lunatimonas sp.]|uniref:tetratricopeptide repeat-containing sensor histidine kinase n=1 Tax=Lunatimonas sp. TaxID=2060141 RepID=UPI00263A7143|nr:tetratricopeptide repeat-containing sensor histidine kinase [Lunatimonas sp.]MCC5938199.1 tetratricopeptide repeat-containing sensor histidine kinase [Lunatimonas sp.]
MRPEIYELYHSSNRLLNSGALPNYPAYLDSLYSQFSGLNSLEQWNKYLHIALFYINFNQDLDMAKAYKDSMDLVLKGKEQVYKVEYSRNFFIEGDILKGRKMFFDAFRSYYNGREFAKNHLPLCTTADLTYQLGLFKYNQRQFDQAIDYFLQAVEEVATCGPDESFNVVVMDPQRYLTTIALSYEKLDKLDSAVFYYEKAKDFINSRVATYPKKSQPLEYHFLEVAEGVVLGNLGGVLAKLGYVENAEKALLRSIEINDRPEYDIPDARTAKIKLAGLYLDQGNLSSAKRLIDELDSSIGRITLKNTSYFDILSRFLRLRWRYYDAIDEEILAYRDLSAYTKLYEENERSAEASRYLDMEEAFRVTEQQYEIAIISRENEIKNIYLLGTLIFLVVAVGFLVNVGYHLRRFRAINRQISQQNIELQDALGALEQSHAENSRMMHIVAHDLRSPISSMTMIADVLLESGNWSEEDRTLIEHIKISGNNSLNLVSEMLQVNRGIEGLQKEEVDLERMLNYCADLLRFKAEEKQQQITLSTEPVKAWISREKMWRVVSNLIANAIKFSHKGGNIHIQLVKKVDRALISIQDHGIGIPDKLKDTLFELFTNSKRYGTDGETPHGMGLAISKQIVKAHGGRIWFESEDGKGSTFFVELPLNESPA